MEKRTKGCLWIALGVAIVAVMVGVALVAGAGFWVYQTVAPEATFLDQNSDRLQAAVVDSAGAVKLESAPVSFFVRRATVHRRAR